MPETDQNRSENQAREVDALNQQAVELYYQNPGEAARLFEQAGRLAQAGPFSDQPYLAGLTASLAGLAKFHMENQPDLSVRYCLQIQSSLFGRPIIPPLIESKNTLGWIYLHLGDYSPAMEWALQALQHSQELGLANLEAASMDLIANIHGTLREYLQALAAHEQALQIARAIPSPQQVASYLNNMAMTLQEMGNYPAALEASHDSLAMFQQLKMVNAIANSHDTKALIYLGLKEFASAEADLLTGLEIAEQGATEVIRAYLNKSLGQVYMAQGDLVKAASRVNQALTIAQKNGMRGIAVECHKLLAEIYERQGQYVLALSSFKLYHTLSQEITGDTATRRLAVLNVIHDVEKARHEAELYRLRTIELQSEIEQRKHIQDALQVLATRDTLTSLYNRRYFLEKAAEEYERAVRYHHPITVMMMDLDNFKVINDTFGHAVGDQALAMAGMRVKEAMRTLDIAGRVGGDEFALVLPETGASAASLAAERLCRSIHNETFVFDGLTVRLTFSIGLSSFTPIDGSHPPSLDVLFKLADQALYKAKHNGRNQVQVSTAS